MNAHDKATLVAQLLVDVGCRHVRLESTLGTIPQINTVRFDATDELKSWFAKASMS